MPIRWCSNGAPFPPPQPFSFFSVSDYINNLPLVERWVLTRELTIPEAVLHLLIFLHIFYFIFGAFFSLRCLRANPWAKRLRGAFEEREGMRLPKQEVYDAYEQFCQRNGFERTNTAALGRLIKKVQAAAGDAATALLWGRT
jgi:hypothetical protein